ncbi:putative site-specific integrase-resolvase [Rhodococcus sp. 27YEA15]|uniref:helix-turn-helix transcriptional regulator n=1 Tax=Rhodococcus sp. 27YEA15 TaxID=3156259 RepID=UPI003C7A5811
MKVYLSRGEIAERLGVALGTIKSYDKLGYLPEPDVKVGRNFGWAPETIDEWNANRPGRGARTDLT